MTKLLQIYSWYQGGVLISLIIMCWKSIPDITKHITPEINLPMTHLSHIVVRRYLRMCYIRL